METVLQKVAGKAWKLIRDGKYREPHVEGAIPGRLASEDSEASLCTNIVQEQLSLLPGKRT